MLQIGGKNSKRHFKIVMGNKEHGLYISSTPSSAAKKAVTKLCAANKSKKVEFHIREITQGSKKKTYGPYTGYIEKLKEPIELKGRVIQYKPVAKLIGKGNKKMKGGEEKSLEYNFNNLGNHNKLSNKAIKILSQEQEDKQRIKEEKKKIKENKEIALEELKKVADGNNINLKEKERLRNQAKKELENAKKGLEFLQQKYPNIQLPNTQERVLKSAADNTSKEIEFTDNQKRVLGRM